LRRTLAYLLAELNAIHPFREGNGRTQLTFLALLADQAGHSLDLDKLDPEATLAAMIKSFKGNEKPLKAIITKLLA
jgi:cell filamentation protein